LKGAIAGHLDATHDSGEKWTQETPAGARPDHFKLSHVRSIQVELAKGRFGAKFKHHLANGALRLGSTG
jgi:hypothetical protein